MPIDKQPLLRSLLEIVPAPQPNSMDVLPPNNEDVLIVPMGDHRPDGDPSCAWLGRCINGIWMLRLEQGWMGRMNPRTAAGWYPMSAAAQLPEPHVRRT